ncbi:MAG: ATP synthase F1 subunit epsilon [Candidatus Hydrogenedentota bacterium]|nr:MAG: ATP synthase F1 subunit epsilon [Candidatus Hydrogenedentota bacterium]
MAERSFKLEIVTLTRVVYTGEAVSIVAPASLGYIGIMANHAPLATDVAIGILKIREPGSEEVFMTVTDGFLVVANNEVSILVNASERSTEIDVERARASIERARERLASRGPDVDVARAEAALKRAGARLKLAGAV